MTITRTSSGRRGRAGEDDMQLPVEMTCGDCVHIARCKAMFGHVETDTYCDWSPSRFHQKKEKP